MILAPNGSQTLPKPEGGVGTHKDWEMEEAQHMAQINMEKQLRDRADRGGRLMGGMQAPGGAGGAWCCWGA